MPIVPKTDWPYDKQALYEIGVAAMAGFCLANNVQPPQVTALPVDRWNVTTCAFYRWYDLADPGFRKQSDPKPSVHICLHYCGFPCGEEMGRNWTWPGNTVDREPYGVLCHELGHHVDWLAGDKKFSYFSDYSTQVMQASGEDAVSNYGKENPAEWFAEAFRLFMTNPGLLKKFRPRTFGAISERWKLILPLDWRFCLGRNVPRRVVRAILNKGIL